MGVSPNHPSYSRIVHETHQAFWSWKPPNIGVSINEGTVPNSWMVQWRIQPKRWMNNGVPLWLRKPPYIILLYIILYIEYIYTIYIYCIYIYTYILYILGGGSLQKWVAFECQQAEDTRQDVGWTSSCSSRSWIFQHASSHLSSGCDLPLAGLMISSRIFFYPSYIGDYNNPIGESL